MRIAILTQYFPPESGAPQCRLSELARRIVERGHEVIVLTGMPNYPKGKIFAGYKRLRCTEEWNKVKVYRSWLYPTNKGGLAARLTNYGSFVASSLLNGLGSLPKVDYLLTESPPLFLGISGYLLSRAKRSRWIFNVSDLWPGSAISMGMVKDGGPMRLAWALEAFCYRRAWMVSGQSREILGDIRNRFPSTKLFHFSNGVDTRFFTPKKRSDALNRELRAGSECVAVYAGLHGFAQGLEQILEAAGRLKPDVSLRIVMIGDGPDKARLEREKERLGLANVTFLPSVARDRMPEIMASADMALVPLRCRLPGAVPSKLYEAMGAGVPVVLSVEGEAATVVKENRAGVVVPIGDSSGLAKVLTTLSQRPSLRRRMGERARRAAEKEFDRQMICDRFIDHLEAAERSDGKSRRTIERADDLEDKAEAQTVRGAAEECVGTEDVPAEVRNELERAPMNRGRT